MLTLLQVIALQLQSILFLLPFSVYYLHVTFEQIT